MVCHKVIEVLNETPVGQLNSIGNFKSRSKYWGSKYGVADRDETGYRVLRKAIINVGGVLVIHQIQIIILVVAIQIHV